MATKYLYRAYISMKQRYPPSFTIILDYGSKGFIRTFDDTEIDPLQSPSQQTLRHRLQHSRFKQIEFSAAIHLPLDQLQPIDLPL